MFRKLYNLTRLIWSQLMLLFSLYDRIAPCLPSPKPLSYYILYVFSSLLLIVISQLTLSVSFGPKVINGNYCSIFQTCFAQLTNTLNWNISQILGECTLCMACSSRRCISFIPPKSEKFIADNFLCWNIHQNQSPIRNEECPISFRKILSNNLVCFGKKYIKLKQF